MRSTLTTKEPLRAVPGALRRAAAEGVEGSSDAGYRFYGAREVDVTAEPETEWAIDPQALDAVGTSRIVFTLLVGRDGSVLYCAIDEPARLTPSQRTALAERLASTRMRPARLAGQPVASRRQVELFTVGGL